MARVKCPHCFHVNPDRQESCEKCGARLPRISIEAPEPARAPAQVPGRSQLQFHRGQVVAGRYTVLNLIGQGGMGSIYKVHDNTLGEDVALKTLLPQFLQDKVVLERFYNEAKIARRLAHPNIVRVHDIGEDGKILYISMEYLQGMSLREILDNLPPGERLPIAQTMRIFDQLCAALEYAHQFTVHRDIKPENVMLSASGRPTLIDFGLARLRDDAPLTARGMCIGSPSYLAPERLDGRPHDARADVYAVGVILYEMIAGVRPFVGDSTVEILSNCRHRPPRPLRAIRRDVSRPLDAVVVRALAKDPRRRFDDAEEMLAALEDVPVLEEQEEREAAVARQEQETTTMLALAPLEPRPSRWQRLWSWWRFGRWRWPRSRRTVGA
ncbi:MAG: protein kinase [Deltaproteobacteria bacterium]|nr:protein kinase [Deltaproteobacteria bacterium]